MDDLADFFKNHRVLPGKFLDRVVHDDQDERILDGHDGCLAYLGSGMVEYGHLADQAAGIHVSEEDFSRTPFAIGFEFAGFDDVHGNGIVAFFEQNVAGIDFPFLGK